MDLHLEFVERPADVAGTQAHHLLGAGGESADAEVRAQNDDRDSRGVDQVGQVITQFVREADPALQLFVDRSQLLVGGLQLFLGGRQLLVGALQLLVGRNDFFIGGPQLLVGSLPYVRSRPASIPLSQSGRA